MLAYRRIIPDKTATVRVEGFEPRDAAETMARICQIADWHRAGSVHREPEDALASVFYEVCASSQYGEPVPPAPLSLEAREAIMRERFEEDYSRPRADLWSDINRVMYGGRR